ncbi:mechanosensitive ion channel family protein [Halpernia frigidisoli]|uniref:Small conductance mechanosensitive channel n=1 Tax=Halpernia frigidisoli TaxID=1125876 RepID=A0A1I3FQ93_9FLAO|nr:mechanosensitive ion channel family protein [Halpernia frigidisoli]SFI13448.1 small conductance mechanosensitive channel [Halpernia frigidisoli]
MNYIDTVYSVLQRWTSEFAAFTPRLVVGLVVFLIIFALNTYLSKVFLKILHKFYPKSKKVETVTTLLGVFKFLILLIGVFISLEIMGLGGFVFKFLGSLGVAGVIAGVALKDLVSSIFSGMLVGVDKAFKVGDYVTIDGVSGTVLEIGFLTTKVSADDGRKIFIPNQLIFSAPFVNTTASDGRKIYISLEIPNTENLTKVKEALADEVSKLEGSQKPEETQIIVVKQSLGVYYIDVRFWMETGGSFLKVRSEAYVQLKSRLDKEGISMVNPLQNMTAAT